MACVRSSSKQRTASHATSWCRGLDLRCSAIWALPSLQPTARRHSLTMAPRLSFIRQILGAVSEFDKAMTVAKLKGARDRVRRQRGKCEGRKSYAEREGGAELVAMARQLHTNPHGRSPCSARRRRFGGSRVRHTNRPPIFRLCRCLDAHSRVTLGALPCHGRSVVCYSGKRRPRAALSHDRPR